MSKTILGPEVGYLDLLDNHLTIKSLAESTQARKYNPLRPSAAGKCAKELAVEYAQYKKLIPTIQEEISPELQRIFATGHAVEYMMIKQLRECGLFDIKYTQQVVRFLQLADGSWLEGSIDLCLTFGPHKGIADWKSKKDRHSSYGPTGWDEANEGYENMQSVDRVSEKLFWINDLPAFLSELKDPWMKPNFIQLNLYANTEFVKQSGIDHASLFYFNKNDCRLREMRFRPSEEVYEQTKEKFRIVHDTISSSTPETVNKATEALTCKVSSNCQYCWPEEAKRAYFETLPPKKWPKATNLLGVTGNKIEGLFELYEEALDNQEAGQTTHDAIVKLMLDTEETKIKLRNGKVWEAKFLKSPKPHHELRRGK